MIYQNHIKPLFKERSGGKLMRGGGGEKCGTYRSGDLIMEGVHRAGHCFRMDKRTLGDGNCFPRAAKQQCDRQAVEGDAIQCHRDLRRKVTRYMLESEDRVVVDMRRRWQELEVRWSWESYWQKMARDGVWVEEPFIWGTAWFLNRDIWIVWDTASPASPLTFFSGNKEGNGMACPGVPLIIGHHTDTHYQSLLPEGDPVSNSFDSSRFAVEITETLQKVCEELQRRSRSKRKEPPACSESKDEGSSENTVLKYGQGEPGVKAKKMKDGGVEYTCLLCHSEQKQIASHMKKSHADVFQKTELEEFQVSLKRFSMAVRNSNRTKKAKRESQSRRRGKRQADNPDAVKAAKKRANDAQRANGLRNFKGEQKYGHIFPCACCHTWKSRDQVVELNQQQVDKIEGKAREFHQTLQVNSFFN